MLQMFAKSIHGSLSFGAITKLSVHVFHDRSKPPEAFECVQSCACELFAGFKPPLDLEECSLDVRASSFSMSTTRASIVARACATYLLLLFLTLRPQRIPAKELRF